MDDSRLLNINDKFRKLSTEEINQIIKNESLPYSIMAINIQSCLNISNIMRTANLCGCYEIVLFGRKSYDRRGCVGSQNYINIIKISAVIYPDRRNFNNLTQDEVNDILDIDIFTNFIEDNNYLPVFIEQDTTSITANNDNIKMIIENSKILHKKLIFIFGNESFGIPKNILDSRHKFNHHYTLELQQKGCIRSYNVANCCSILCYKIMEIFNKL